MQQMPSMMPAIVPAPAPNPASSSLRPDEEDAVVGGADGAEGRTTRTSSTAGAAMLSTSTPVTSESLVAIDGSNNVSTMAYASVGLVMTIFASTRMLAASTVSVMSSAISFKTVARPALKEVLLNSSTVPASLIETSTRV